MPSNPFDYDPLGGDNPFLKRFRSDYNQEPAEPVNQTPTLGDYARQVGAGVLDVGQALGYGIEKLGVPSVGRPIRESSRNVAQYLTQGLPEGATFTPDAPEFVKPLFQGQTPAAKKAQDVHSLGDISLSTIGLTAARSLPGMAAIAGPGIAVARGLAAAGVPQFVASGVGLGGAEGVFSGAINASDEGLSVREAPIEVLAKHPAFQARYAATDPNLPEPERQAIAREQIAGDVESQVFNRTALTTGAIGAATGGGGLGELVNKTRSTGIFTTALKAAGQEALQEAPQSALERYHQNVARQDFIDPDQELSEGVGTEAVVGGLAGGLTGGLFGGVGAFGTPYVAPGAQPAQPEGTQNERPSVDRGGLAGPDGGIAGPAGGDQVLRIDPDSGEILTGAPAVQGSDRDTRPAPVIPAQAIQPQVIDDEKTQENAQRNADVDGRGLLDADAGQDQGPGQEGGADAQGRQRKETLAPWQQSELAEVPDFPTDAVKIRKKEDGTFGIFYKSSDEPLFPEQALAEVPPFTKASEAKKFFEQQRALAKREEVNRELPELGFQEFRDGLLSLKRDMTPGGDVALVEKPDGTKFRTPSTNPKWAQDFMEQHGYTYKALWGNPDAKAGTRANKGLVQAAVDGDSLTEKQRAAVTDLIGVLQEQGVAVRAEPVTLEERERQAPPEFVESDVEPAEREREPIEPEAEALPLTELYQRARAIDPDAAESSLEADNDQAAAQKLYQVIGQEGLNARTDLQSVERRESGDVSVDEPQRPVEALGSAVPGTDSAGSQGVEGNVYDEPTSDRTGVERAVDGIPTGDRAVVPAENIGSAESTLDVPRETDNASEIQSTSALDAGQEETDQAEEVAPFTPTHTTSDGEPVISIGDNLYRNALDEEIVDRYAVPIQVEKQKARLSESLPTNELPTKQDLAVEQSDTVEPGIPDGQPTVPENLQRQETATSAAAPGLPGTTERPVSGGGIAATGTETTAPSGTIATEGAAPGFAEGSTAEGPGVPGPGEAERVQGAGKPGGETAGTVARKPNKNAEKLRNIAARAIESAKSEQSRDRLSNTPKRAREAGYAVDKALAEEALGKTMVKIADAIDAGTVKKLASVSNKAQVEMLSSMLTRAKYLRDQKRFQTYADQERQQGRKAELDDVEFIEYPEAEIRENSLPRLRATLRETRGGKGLADSIGRVLTKDQYDKIVKVLGQKKADSEIGWYPVEELKRQSRLKAMGINNHADLQEAAKEFVTLQAGKAAEDPVAVAERALVGRKVGVDFFPTPKPLAERMAEMAGVSEQSTVLEPSAGNGNLADAAKKAGANVDTIEISQDLRDVLKAKQHKIVANNFDDFQSEQQYDAVIMNPPFSNRKDAAHIQKAFDFVKPGGKLVAIAGEGVFFGSDKKAVAFREWLDQHNATVEKLPEKTFMDKSVLSQTGVNARLVVVEKAAVAKPVAPNTGEQTEAPSAETERQYGRNDVDYDTWYSDWMKRLAKDYSREQLERKLHGTKREAKRAAESHLKAIEASGSMQSNSQRRAQARNVTAAKGDEAIALRGALEIHELFPEHAHQSVPDAAINAAKKNETAESPAVPDAVESSVEPQQAPASQAPFSKNDIPYDRAYNAHGATSFSPDKRAKAVQDAYVAHMQAVYDDVIKHADSEAATATINSAFQDYRSGYIKRMLAYLDAESRTMSPMITGPSSFPTRSNQKKLNTADKRRNELAEWDKHARNRLKKAARGVRSEVAAKEEQFEVIRRKIDNDFDVIKAIDAGTSFYDRSAFVNSITGALRTLARNGQTDTVNRALDYIEAEQKGLKKPLIAPRNSVWELRNQTVSNTPSQTGTVTLKTYAGAEVVNNHDAQRVQILFDGKPDAATRDKLKSSGFRWSPKEQAWQRQNTVNGIAAAERVLDGLYEPAETTTAPEQPNRAASSLRERAPVAPLSQSLVDPWEKSDLATTPNIPDSYVTAKKQTDGTFQLLYKGTENQVFSEESLEGVQPFKTASEAQKFFRSQRELAQEFTETQDGKRKWVRDEEGVWVLNPELRPSVKQTLDQYFGVVGGDQKALYSFGRNTAPISKVADLKVPQDYTGINVVQSVSELPEALRREGVEAVYDPASDQVYVVADNVTKDDFRSVLHHEMYHRARHTDPKLHRQLRKLDDRLRPSFNRAKNGKGSDIEKAAWNRAKAYPEAEQFEEFQAFLVTEFNRLPKAGKLVQWVKDKIAAVRAALVRMGIPIGEITPSVLNALARYGAASNSQVIDAENAKYMVAYHGSPYDFEKFTTGKIGSGEGVQAYGYGLYFADSKRVAEWYKNTLTKRSFTFKGEPISRDAAPVDLQKQFPNLQGNEAEILHNILSSAYFSGDLSAYSDFIINQIKTAFNDLSNFSNTGNQESSFTGAANYLTNKRLASLRANLEVANRLKDEIRIGGKLYQVELAPEPDEYLLWDKPYQQQSDKVKEALNKAFKDKGYPIDNDGTPLIFNATLNDGNSLYASISTASGGANKGSEVLHRYGIRGIKYLDGTSRSKGEGAYNYVLFSDDDVSITVKYSLAGQPTADDIFREQDAQLKDTTFWGAAKDKALDNFYKLSDGARKVALAFLTVNQVVDVAHNTIPSLKTEFAEIFRSLETEKNKIHNIASDVENKWIELPRKEANRMAHVMHLSTIHGVDPTRDFAPYDVVAAQKRIRVIDERLRLMPGEKNDDLFEEKAELKRAIKAEPGRVKRYPQVKEMYDHLSADAKTIYNEAKDYHYNQAMRVRGALEEIIERSGASKQEKAARIAKLHLDFQKLLGHGVYFTLFRDGDYWVSSIDKDGERSFDLFATREQQDAFITEIKKDGAEKVESGTKLDEDKFKAAIPASVAVQVDTIVGQLGSHPAVLDVRDQLYQLYLRSLPQLSAKKHFIHRKNTKGFSDDALRAFAHKAFHDGYFYAKLKHGTRMQEYMDELGATIKTATTQKRYDADKTELDLLREFNEKQPGEKDITKLKEYIDDLWRIHDRAAKELGDDNARTVRVKGMLDEARLRYRIFSEAFGRGEPYIGTRIEALQKRLDTADIIRKKEHGADFAAKVFDELNAAIEHAMNPKTHPVAVAINSLGFIFHLGVSPAAAVVNMFQVPGITLPWLASKFGYWRSAAALRRAYKDFFAGRDKDHMYTIHHALKNQDERNMYAALNDSGHFDKGRFHDLAGVSEGGFNRGVAARKWMNFISAGFNFGERLNRETTGLAAYRLARKDGNGHNEAVQFAMDAIDDTHLNYMASNRPRILRSNLARVIGQFKMYPQGMLYLQWKAFYEAFKNADPQVKAEARKFIGYQMVTQIALAGTLGLPLGAPFALLSALDYDEDDPFDWEAEYRQFLADYLGKTGGEIASKGLVNALTPIDLHSRLNMSDLIFREPNQELEGSNFYHYITDALLGPVLGGTLKGMFDAQDLFREGHTQRGLELFLPKAIKDVSKAIRELDEGIVTRRGDPLIEDVGVAIPLLRSIGFGSSRESDQYDENNAIKGLEKRLLARQSLLRGLAANARLRGDAKEYEDAVERIQEFNEKNPDMRITLDSIQRSMRSRRAYSNRAEHGVAVGRRFAPRAAEVDFAR